MDFEDKINLALQKAKWCFTPHAFPTVGSGIKLACLEGAITKIFDGATRVIELRTSRENRRQDFPPDSTEDFLSQSACVFSAAFSTHLRDKFNTFDEVCGQPI